jgi:hypothetical protein
MIDLLTRRRGLCRCGRDRWTARARGLALGNEKRRLAAIRRREEAAEANPPGGAQRE